MQSSLTRVDKVQEILRFTFMNELAVSIVSFWPCLEFVIVLSPLVFTKKPSFPVSKNIFV